MSNYYEKYIKYKQKYLTLKKQEGGDDNEESQKVSDDIFFEILKYKDCKDIINSITSKKFICKFRSFTKVQWYQLIDNIKIPDYSYTYSETNHEDPEDPQHPYRSLMTQDILCNDNIYCRLFFTKCLHKHLIEKYNNNDLTECWFQSIRENNINDYQHVITILLLCHT